MDELDEMAGSWKPAKGYSSIDEMIARIDVDLEAAGRPKPVYMPHTLDTAKSADLYSGGGGGGAGPPRKAGPLNQTMGVLLGRGQLLQTPQVLVGSFHKSVKTALYRDIHAVHLEHSVPLRKGDPVPQGWQIVRSSHAERTNYTTRKGAAFEEFAKEYLDDSAEFQFRENPFTTRGTAEAFVDEKGQHRIVPTAFSKQLTGEFIRAGNFVYYLNKYPVRVWRHLVLKLRPAWLVNNIIGNTLLYLVHSSDPVALQEFGRVLKSAHPKHADRFDAIMRKHFPEQVSGTFIGSQLPISRVGSKMEKYFERPASFVGVGIAQVDRWWEQGLRKAVVRAELRKSPEMREFVGKMRRQTDEAWDAIDKRLDADPVFVERITARGNDALGDFLSLGRFERDYVRAFFPFYAWYRVITAITLKMPLTHPYKAALLSRLGEAGVTSVLEEMGLEDELVINSAKAFVPIGDEEDGRIPGISTLGANPFATVSELSEFVGALANGEPGEAWRHLPGANPMFTIPIEWASGARPRSGNPRAKNRFGLIGNVAERYARSIPQVNLIDALAGTKHSGTKANPTLIDVDPLDSLMRYMGIPYGRMDPDRAAEIARIGR